MLLVERKLNCFVVNMLDIMPVWIANWGKSEYPCISIHASVLATKCGVA